MRGQTFQDIKEEGYRLRRELVAEAAERVLFNKPYQEIHLKDVAAEARVSVPVIYHYFESFDDLLLEVFKRAGHAILEDAERGEVQSAEEVVSLFVASLVDNGIIQQVIRQFVAQGHGHGEMLELFSGLKESARELARDRCGEDVPGGSLFMDAVFAMVLGFVIACREDMPAGKREVLRCIRQLASCSDVIPVTGVKVRAA